MDMEHIENIILRLLTAIHQSINKKTSNVRMKATLRHFRETTAAVEKK